MKKLYPLLCLLLWSVVSLAQNAMQTAYTAPAGSLILDFGYGKVLTVQQNAGVYTYNLVDIKTGGSTLIPLNKKYQPTSYQHIAEHHNAWVTPEGVLIMAQSPTRDSVWALYELHQSRFTKLAENIGNVNTAGNFVLWSELDTMNMNSGGRHPTYRNIILRTITSGDQFVLTDSAVIEAVIGLYDSDPLYRSLNFSSGKNVHSEGIQTDHIWQTAADKRPAYFYGLHAHVGTVSYLRYIENENTVVGLYGNLGRFLTMNDKGSAVNFPEVISGPVFKIIDYRGTVMAGITKTNPDTDRLEGKIYIRDFTTGIRYLQDLQPGTPFAYANITEMSSPQADIGVRAAGEGQAPAAYLFSYDGRLKKKVADNATGIYFEKGLWYVTDTQHLYVTNIDTVYNYYVASTTKPAYTSIRNPFTFSDFNGPYNGPDTGLGSIQRIQITAFPKQGVLANKNNLPILGNNPVIQRADLDSIKYSATQFPGLDSIRWRAFDGVKWTQDTVMYINVALNPGIVTPFERSTMEGTPIRFWASNFKQHFSGKLAYVWVNIIPKYGNLTIGGKRLYYDRSTVVTLEELDSMYYTANPNITGVDTLWWRGWINVPNVDWSLNDTVAILRVYPVLNTPPILRTLESSYNKAGMPDTILVANYPRPTWHTDAKVIVDGSRVLLVDSNKHFILDPSVYSAGPHQLKVYFKHPLDSIGITRTFTITSTLSPLMTSAEKYGITEDTGPLNAWPNPFRQQFTLTGLSESGTYIITLVNQQGQTVLQQRIVNQNRVVLNLDENAGTGVYLLKILNENKKDDVKTLKLLHL